MYSDEEMRVLDRIKDLAEIKFKVISTWHLLHGCLVTGMKMTLMKKRTKKKITTKKCISMWRTYVIRVTTKLSKEAVMAKLKQRKYSSFIIVVFVKWSMH
ncbi:unnamed protein product, partial [Vitis vinifera]